ncbi:MAG: hypothetical protein KatS3mg054_0025 [Chloroflexus sp.]|nr:MAG: hypothetical protein KatS3mg054_0025 [Chloroflexus sp.]
MKADPVTMTLQMPPLKEMNLGQWRKALGFGATNVQTWDIQMIGKMASWIHTRRVPYLNMNNMFVNPWPHILCNPDEYVDITSVYDTGLLRTRPVRRGAVHSVVSSFRFTAQSAHFHNIDCMYEFLLSDEAGLPNEPLKVDEPSEYVVAITLSAFGMKVTGRSRPMYISVDNSFVRMQLRDSPNKRINSLQSIICADVDSLASCTQGIKLVDSFLYIPYVPAYVPRVSYEDLFNRDRITLLNSVLYVQYMPFEQKQMLLRLLSRIGYPLYDTRYNSIWCYSSPDMAVYFPFHFMPYKL